MTPRTWTLIGLTIVALGLGVYALGLFSEEARVRQVADVLAEPAAHATGTWTVVGTPQPALVPASADGQTVLRPNPAYAKTTEHVELLPDGAQEVHRITVASDEAGHHFTYTRSTVRPGVGATEQANATWTVTGHVFPIEGFDGQRIWAVYDGVLKEPLQPKPSQFTGRLMTHLPDGAALPAGAMLLQVDEVTVGCSSKFMPDEA